MIVYKNECGELLIISQSISSRYDTDTNRRSFIKNVNEVYSSLVFFFGGSEATPESPPDASPDDTPPDAHPFPFGNNKWLSCSM